MPSINLNDSFGPVPASRILLFTILAVASGAIDLDTDQGRRQVLGNIATASTSTNEIRNLSAFVLQIASDAARPELEALMRTARYQTRLSDLANGTEADTLLGMKNGCQP
jgi:hypothetical protein